MTIIDAIVDTPEQEREPSILIRTRQVSKPARIATRIIRTAYDPAASSPTTAIAVALLATTCEMSVAHCRGWT
jgi:hypothetical protein